MTEAIPPCTTPVTSERRQFIRYCLMSSPRTRFLAQPGFQFGEGRLKDVSASGFCLILENPLSEEARLIVQLPGRRRGSSLTRSARVRRVEPDGEGRWLIGCELSALLSEDEMEALRLLGQPAALSPPQ